MSAPSSRRNLHTSVLPCWTAQARTVALGFSEDRGNEGQIQTVHIEVPHHASYIVRSSASRYRPPRTKYMPITSPAKSASVTQPTNNTNLKGEAPTALKPLHAG